MPDDLTLDALYDWACRIEEELDEYKNSFPEVLAADRNRCIASFRCLRISLELRVQARFPKRADPPRRSTQIDPPTFRISA